MNIQHLPLSSLKTNSRNARTHSKKQVAQIADSIKTFGFVVPIVVDDDLTILAGHGRRAAAESLQHKEVPVVVVSGLSQAKKRALALADNKIPENAGWDRELLAAEIAELSEILVGEDLNISITGFSPAEIDALAIDLEDNSSDPADEIKQDMLRDVPVTKPGDLWLLGKHRLLCGDARATEGLSRLMDGNRAAMVFIDPPYNLRVRDIGGRGQTKHEEFAMGSGEMSQVEFIEFLGKSLQAVASVSKDGSVHFVCIDWRHIAELLQAASAVYAETLNVAVWVKSNAGQGSFYRSQHELVGVFRVGHNPHQNNIELGRHGRNRSNVWHYAGVNTFRRGRQDDLKVHPTVKPIGLVADAIKDCTKRNDIVVDTFCGSGTTILAAERVGRLAYGLEFEPRFVDVTIRRWQDFTRKDAIHALTGRAFDEILGDRTVASLPSVAA